MKQTHILIVDDSKTARTFLSKAIAPHLSQPICLAETGGEAIKILEDRKVGTIILDHNLPDMTGLDFLMIKNLTADWKPIPVLVMTAEEHTDELIRDYFHLGVTDFVPKTNFNHLIFTARIQRCLSLYDAIKEQERDINQLNTLQGKQEELLKSTLPQKVYQEIVESGRFIPITPKDTAVLFADVCGFTQYSVENTPAKLVTNLNRLIRRFERISSEYDLVKIKTIGDEYMAVSGVFEKSYSFSKVVQAALQMVKETIELNIGWEIKVGIATGPLVGGIIGSERVQFDVWGNTVNLAARMCRVSEPGQVAIPNEILGQVEDMPIKISTCSKDVKGIGPMQIALLSA
jgi:adenylate cyclase